MDVVEIDGFAETSNALPVDLFLDRVTLQYSIP